MNLDSLSFEAVEPLPHRLAGQAPAQGATSAPKPSFLTRQVSIHTPRAGRDDRKRVLSTLAKVFQSTRPARGATHLEQRKR